MRRQASPLRVRISEWRVVGEHKFPFFSDRHVEYLVETSEDAIEDSPHSHTVWRRYSDFQVLEETLEIPVPRLPPRRVIGNFSDPVFVEERKFLLEDFLRKILLLPQAVTSSILWNFLATAPETCLVPRLVARPEILQNVKAVETLALDPRNNFRLMHNRPLLATLLDIVSEKFPIEAEQQHAQCMHSALVVLRSMVIGNFFPPAHAAEQFILPLLKISGRANAAPDVAAAGRGVLLDLVEKFPDTVFYFFQKEAGVEVLLLEISDDRKFPVVAELLWLGVAGSRDACVALTEKNSKGPELFVSLAHKCEKFPGLLVLLAASISVLARTANAQPRLLQLLERVVEKPGNFWKFPASVLTVLFRSERGTRKILEIFDREDLPSRYACLLISCVARARPELLPVRKELGEQLLKAIKTSTDRNFRSLAAQTLLTVAGFTETLLSPDERTDLMRFVIGNLREAAKIPDSLPPLSAECSGTARILGPEIFEREIYELVVSLAELRLRQEAVRDTSIELSRKFEAAKTGGAEISRSLTKIDEMLENADSGEVFEKLNMQEAELRGVMEEVAALRFEKLQAAKEELDRAQSAQQVETQQRASAREKASVLIEKLNDLVNTLS